MEFARSHFLLHYQHIVQWTGVLVLVQFRLSQLGKIDATQLTILEEKAFARLCIALPERWTGHSEEAGTISQLYFFNLFLNCISQLYFSNVFLN